MCKTHSIDIRSLLVGRLLTMTLELEVVIFSEEHTVEEEEDPHQKKAT